MCTKPVTKAELVEYISDTSRLSTLTVPALNTIHGIISMHSSSKRSKPRPPRVEAARAADPEPPTLTPRARGCDHHVRWDDRD